MSEEVVDADFCAYSERSHDEEFDSGVWIPEPA
jgi:hypothetical protein